MSEMEEINSKDFSDLKSKVDKIYYALMPNELLDSGGLIGEMKSFRVELKECKEEIQTIKSKNIKFEIYQKIMWSGLGTTAGLIAAYLLEILALKK